MYILQNEDHENIRRTSQFQRAENRKGKKKITENDALKFVVYRSKILTKNLKKPTKISKTRENIRNVQITNAP